MAKAVNLIDAHLNFEKGDYIISIKTHPAIEKFFKSTNVKASEWGVKYYGLPEKHTHRKIINGNTVLLLNQFGGTFHPANVSMLRSVGITQGVHVRCSSAALYSRADLEGFMNNLRDAARIIRSIQEDGDASSSSKRA